MLTKEQYYTRRWFLAVLFLISGLWLTYTSYGMFGYHRSKEELKKEKSVPSKILIEKSESTENRFLTLFLGNKKIGSVVEQPEIEKIIALTQKKEFSTINSPVLGNELSGIDFEYLYWNDKLYELKVNENIVIEYKKESKSLAYIFLTIGILWSSFQIWVIFTLVTKGISIYDKSFKENKKIDIKPEAKVEVKAEVGNSESEIIFFPEIESIFAENIEKNKELFFPVCTIDLGTIKKEWSNEKIHLIQFHEDPYNTETAKYFNEYCKDNMISFTINEGKYKFNTDFEYFDLTDDWREYYEETKLVYNKSKTEFKESGKTFNLEKIKIGGEPEWWQADSTPLDPDGNPMTFVTEIETYGFCPDSCDKKIFMFYSHKHKLVVELYQIT